MTYAIEIAESQSAILSTFPIMKQLRPHLKRSAYVALVQTQASECGFQLALLKSRGTVRCVAGFRLCRSLGWGPYLYVDDLITDENSQSKGYGRTMFEWLKKYGKQHHCAELRLDSALWRTGAHRFYLRERMDIACFHFRLDLTPVEKGTGFRTRPKA